MERQLHRRDEWIGHFDRVLRTLCPGEASAERANPALDLPPVALTSAARRSSTGWLRVRHASEAGQLGLGMGERMASTQASGERESSLQHAMDHVIWCDQRLRTLESRPSPLAPLVFIGALGAGAGVTLVSDRAGLGMVASATERAARQCQAQALQLPADDAPTQALFKRMGRDNAHGAQLALEAGGARLPAPLEWGFRGVTRLFAKLVYHV
ncbi:3-demethoxyubiquinol 3-hydroxylase [Halomonas dongshanensis]|uniref:Demethoxyubiquinone hydroxylase family protein n=1 Tax=Halomonas dongshanensis TaxID=2890835 RepID=A0ABT2ED29_9GAMM|nr:demethoxyubiquinone hydroxylase family protein [Halomonas dongshanensis]MCS2609473.1 demethoxyubiquinone hydroxylase family protein [Halomonas dongshanensis]